MHGSVDEGYALYTTNMSSDIKFNIARYTLDIPEENVTIYTPGTQLISPNYYDTPSITKSKIDPFKWFNF